MTSIENQGFKTPEANKEKRAGTLAEFIKQNKRITLPIEQVPENKDSLGLGLTKQEMIDMAGQCFFKGSLDGKRGLLEYVDKNGNFCRVDIKIGEIAQFSDLMQEGLNNLKDVQEAVNNALSELEFKVGEESDALNKENGVKISNLEEEYQKRRKEEQRKEKVI